MKYIFQIGIILIISFIGEILNYYIPLPIPASIYGFIILFILLELKIIKLDMVDGVSKILIEVMPIMFVPAAVGLLESIDILKANIISYIIILIVSTVVVMAVAGIVSELIIKLKNRKEVEENDESTI